MQDVDGTFMLGVCQIIVEDAGPTFMQEREEYSPEENIFFYS